MNTTTQTRSLKRKATIFKVIPLEKQQLVEEKDADNIKKVWKVLCKSFISGLRIKVVLTVLVLSGYSFVAAEPSGSDIKCMYIVRSWYNKKKISKPTRKTKPLKKRFCP